MKRIPFVIFMILIFTVVGLAKFGFNQMHFYTLGEDQLEKVKSVETKLLIIKMLEKADIPKEKLNEVYEELLNAKGKVASLEEEIYGIYEQIDELIRNGNYDEVKEKMDELKAKYKEREKIINDSLRKVVKILNLKEKLMPFRRPAPWLQQIPQAPQMQRIPRIPALRRNIPQFGYPQMYQPGYIMEKRIRSALVKKSVAGLLQVLKKEIFSDEFLDLLGSMVE